MYFLVETINRIFNALLFIYRAHSSAARFVTTRLGPLPAYDSSHGGGHLMTFHRKTFRLKCVLHKNPRTFRGDGNPVKTARTSFFFFLFSSPIYITGKCVYPVEININRHCIRRRVLFLFSIVL